MKLSELIALFRYEADDVKTPYLWDDVRVTEFANDAVREAAVRARLLLDSQTPEVCLIDFDAGTDVVALDPRVVFVRRAIIDGQQYPLYFAYRKTLDATRLGWEIDRGQVLRIIKDWQSGALRLHPIPDVAGTIRLTVIREPLADMTRGDDVPEIPVRHHRRLVLWMLALAYRKKDSGGDARDDKLAASYAAQFDAIFGPSLGARDENFIAQEEDIADEQGGTY